jgi:hypothetical protein
MNSLPPEIDLAVSEAPKPTGPRGGAFNPRAYANTPLCGSSIEQDYKENPDALHGDKEPNTGILREQPVHRIMVLLKAQGKSNREIAEFVGRTENNVSQILRQPWARERLLLEINGAGRDAVQELLRGEVTNSIFKIIEVRDGVTTEPHVQLAASNSLLDRFLGKPTQRVESMNTNLNATVSPEKLDEELARTEAEIARLTGSTTSSGEAASHVEVKTS